MPRIGSAISEIQIDSIHYFNINEEDLVEIIANHIDLSDSIPIEFEIINIKLVINSNSKTNDLAFDVYPNPASNYITLNFNSTNCKDGYRIVFSRCRCLFTDN